MPSEVIIRLGSHAEKDYLLKTIERFSGTVVGANLLEMTPGATVSLAWRMQSANKGFYIDPMTYVFSIDLDYISSEFREKQTKQITRDLKKSFRSMCKQLGGSFETIVLGERRSLTPNDLASESAITAMCSSVMNYQINRMRTICEGDPQLKEVAGETLPTAVFAPYFYIPSDNASFSTEWEDVCVRLTQTFGKLESPVPKHAVLCIARRTLKDRTRLQNLLEKVMASGCDACWLWISTLREEDITDAEMINLVLLVKQAKANDFPVWNLHGGFLSALLNKHGMAGFSHGIGYGESKDVLPVSGGALPTVAYHFNPLHVKSSVPDIERAFSSIDVENAEDFHDKVCPCIICRGTLRGDLRNFEKFGELILKPGNRKMSQTAESAKLCRFHFLLARKIELDLVNRSSLEDLKKILSAVASDYQKLGRLIKLSDKAAALARWVSHI